MAQKRLFCFLRDGDTETFCLSVNGILAANPPMHHDFASFGRDHIAFHRHDLVNRQQIMKINIQVPYHDRVASCPGCQSKNFIKHSRHRPAVGMIRRSFGFRPEPNSRLQTLLQVSIIAHPVTITVRFAGDKSERRTNQRWRIKSHPTVLTTQVNRRTGFFVRHEIISSGKTSLAPSNRQRTLAGKTSDFNQGL